MSKQEMHEAAIRRFIRNRPLSLYDVGVGLKSEWRTLSKLYPDLGVFGCEPHPETYQTLKGRFVGTLENIAIGEKVERAVLYDIHYEPHRASLLPFPEHDRQIPVDTWTLDHFDEVMGRRDRIILWMDIEGSELTALRSGEALLASGRVRWINLEERRNGNRSDEGWPDPRELRALLQEAGYIRVADYNRHPTHQDVIYVHEEELG